jgi:hypothetical protein
VKKSTKWNSGKNPRKRTGSLQAHGALRFLNHVPLLRIAELESVMNCCECELLEKLYLYNVHIWCAQLCIAGEAVPVSDVNSSELPA